MINRRFNRIDNHMAGHEPKTPAQKEAMLRKMERMRDRWLSMGYGVPPYFYEKMRRLEGEINDLEP